MEKGVGLDEEMVVVVATEVSRVMVEVTLEKATAEVTLEVASLDSGWEVEIGDHKRGTRNSKYSRK